MASGGSQEIPQKPPKHCLSHRGKPWASSATRITTGPVHTSAGSFAPALVQLHMFLCRHPECSRAGRGPPPPFEGCRVRLAPGSATVVSSPREGGRQPPSTTAATSAGWRLPPLPWAPRVCSRSCFPCRRLDSPKIQVRSCPKISVTGAGLELATCRAQPRRRPTLPN